MYSESRSVKPPWAGLGPDVGSNRGIREFGMTQAVLRLVNKDDADKKRALEAA